MSLVAGRSYSTSRGCHCTSIRYHPAPNTAHPLRPAQINVSTFTADTGFALLFPLSDPSSAPLPRSSRYSTPARSLPSTDDVSLPPPLPLLPLPSITQATKALESDTDPLWFRNRRSDGGPLDWDASRKEQGESARELLESVRLYQSRRPVCRWCIQSEYTSAARYGRGWIPSFARCEGSGAVRSH